jgi:hypothetical protein
MARDADQRGKKSYYGEKLAAERLQKVYDLAPEPVRRYLGGRD